MTNIYKSGYMNDLNAGLVTYGFLAKEYYKESKHPTCSNFRQASKIIMIGLMKDLGLTPSMQIVEVGAGRSVVAEIFLELNMKVENFVISDFEQQMLEHSRIYGSKWELRKLDAENTELPDSSIDIVFSSLGDPYNTEKFWREVCRIMKPGGSCVFTTPSYDWCKEFRSSDDKFHFAQFEVSSGEKVFVPSYIFSETAQNLLINRVGLKSEKTTSITLNNILSQKISEKLLTKKGPDLPVVTGYVIKKAKTIHTFV